MLINVIRFWPRERDSESLFYADVCPVPTTLKVERNPTTGELLGYNEVCIYKFIRVKFPAQIGTVTKVMFQALVLHLLL